MATTHTYTKIQMTWLPGEDSPRGFGDWLSSKTVATDIALKAFYPGPIPISAEEIPDLLMAANEHGVIVSIEP